MKRNKLVCPECGYLISKSNFNKHIASHRNNPKYQRYVLKRQSIDHEGLNCKYCGKLCKNKMSLAQHEIRCKNNPDKLNTIGNSALKVYVLKNGS